MAVVFLAGCKKETTSPDCLELRKALQSNDEEKIIEAVNSYLAQYTLAINSGTDFEKFVKKLDDQCGLQIIQSCFECVDTNPPISEIAISLLNGATPERKTIDFWTDPQLHVFKAIAVH